MKKYIIEDIEYEGITYRALSAKEIKKMFKQWQCQLDKAEKRQLKKYRNHSINKGNLNEKLRNEKGREKAEIISKAISKARLEENIIVYRNIAKQEKDDIQKQLKKDDGKRLYFKDFKGTHVGKDIKVCWKCSGYIKFLIPAGSPVAYINDLSNRFRREKELLIDKGQEYIFIEQEKEDKGGAYIVKLNLERNSSMI